MVFVSSSRNVLKITVFVWYSTTEYLKFNKYNTEVTLVIPVFTGIASCMGFK